MGREFLMPSLGADMEAGTLVKWCIEPGGHVHRGDIVALVETEKGIIDIESFEDGVVERLTVQPGTRVPVGTPLAIFAGEPAAAPAERAAPATAAPAAGSAAPTAGGATPVAAVTGAVERAARRMPRTSPAARVRAAALGVELSGLQGTGPQGVITLRDVEHAATAAVLPATGAPRAAQSAMRQAIAAAMARSKREIPHYYLQLAMDFGAAAGWLERFNESRPVPERLLAPVLLIKAAARAAAEQPGFNGYFGESGFEPASAVHIGVAIALRSGGLVAPAILDADQKPLAILMRELQDLVARVRAGHMRGSELTSATLTVTSLGEEGADTVYPIIYPPQVAIVGYGSVLDRPWVVDGRLEVRPVLNLTLAADHRVTDGRQGARFLARIRHGLMRPGDL